MIHSGIKEEFSLYKKLWDSLDYGEKLDKSDTKLIFSGSLFLVPETVVVNQLRQHILKVSERSVVYFSISTTTSID